MGSEVDDETTFEGFVDLDTQIVVPDAADLAKTASGEVIGAAHDAVRAHGSFTWVLSGGNTPRRLYELLAADGFRDRMPWDRAHVFWGDERHVPPDHAESDYRMAWETMLSKVPIPATNVHRIEAELADAEAAARRYQDTIQATFRSLGRAVEPIPSFDLVLLGLGADGHTASLFPGSSAITEARRWVVAPWVEKFRTFRITMTPPLLTAASLVLFLVAGADKADAVYAAQNEDLDPLARPSQAITSPVYWQAGQPTVKWLLDSAAASRSSRPESTILA